MVRAIDQVSLMNYFGIVQPKLTEREKWVLEALEEIQPACAEQVANHLKVPINVISGRMTGLKKKNKIVKAYRGINNRNANVDYWKANEADSENDSH